VQPPGAWPTREADWLRGFLKKWLATDLFAVAGIRAPRVAPWGAPLLPHGIL
jgi:hypothetical protein